MDGKSILAKSLFSSVLSSVVICSVELPGVILVSFLFSIKDLFNWLTTKTGKPF